MDYVTIVPITTANTCWTCNESVECAFMDSYKTGTSHHPVEVKSEFTIHICKIGKPHEGVEKLIVSDWICVCSLILHERPAQVWYEATETTRYNLLFHTRVWFYFYQSLHKRDLNYWFLRHVYVNLSYVLHVVLQINVI